MQRNESGETLVEVLRGRIQRRCEAEGVPFEDPSREELTGDWTKFLSVADILRMRERSGPQVS